MIFFIKYTRIETIQNIYTSIFQLFTLSTYFLIVHTLTISIEHAFSNDKCISVKHNSSIGFYINLLIQYTN